MTVSAQSDGRRGRLIATIMALGLIFGLGYGTGFIVRRNDLSQLPGGAWLGRSAPGGIPTPPGSWRRMREPIPDAERTQEAIKRLESIGYVGGYNPAPDASAVTVHERESAHPGLNLYISGHACKAFLMTMDGVVAHEWSYDFRKVWPQYVRPRNDLSPPWNTEHWRRVYMYDNGDLLAIHEGIGMIKLNKDSQLLWAYPGRCHHDLFVAADGTIYVLTRKAHIVERIHPTQPILEDFITLLEADGSVGMHLSILECFENSRYAPALNLMKLSGDIFHTNALEILDGHLADRSSAFAPGNALISIRELNLIAVVDIEARAVVYTASGMWVKQHDPTIVNGGRILLFDNLGQAGRSKAVEFDPFSQEVYWSYGARRSEDLFSKSSGSSQRLPNGNTLITESDNGRAIEVTPANEIVWEFINPARAGPHNELIATVSELLRIWQPERLAWLEGDWFSR